MAGIILCQPSLTWVVLIAHLTNHAMEACGKDLYTYSVETPKPQKKVKTHWPVDTFETKGYVSPTVQLASAQQNDPLLDPGASCRLSFFGILKRTTRFDHPST